MVTASHSGLQETLRNRKHKAKALRSTYLEAGRNEGPKPLTAEADNELGSGFRLLCT